MIFIVTVKKMTSSNKVLDESITLLRSNYWANTILYATRKRETALLFIFGRFAIRKNFARFLSELELTQYWDLAFLTVHSSLSCLKASQWETLPDCLAQALIWSFFGLVYDHRHAEGSINLMEGPMFCSVTSSQIGHRFIIQSKNSFVHHVLVYPYNCTHKP